MTRTYFPDNGPVKYNEVHPKGSHDSTVIDFTPAPEKAYGIQKELYVELDAKGSVVHLNYDITNFAKKPTELAPWLPSVMAPGGVEVIPLPPHHPHPGPVKPETKPADYGPSLNMILWPYFDFTDKRWTLGSKYITLRQDAKKGPTKLGFGHRLGWTGYLNGGTLFVKRFGYQEGANYPDGGCNYETFTKEEFLEMESLGPVVTVKPGRDGDAGARAGSWSRTWKTSPTRPASTRTFCRRSEASNAHAGHTNPKRKRGTRSRTFCLACASGWFEMARRLHSCFPGCSPATPSWGQS